MTEWPDVIARLFARHRARLESLVTRRIRDRDMAAELVQDVFMRMLEAGGTGTDDGDRRVIYAAARNAAIDCGLMTARRSRLLASVLPEQMARAPVPPGAALEAKEAIAALDTALSELSPKAREIFILHRVEGEPTSRIAARFGISVSAVEKHLARTLRHCQKRLASHR